MNNFVTPSDYDASIHRDILNTVTRSDAQSVEICEDHPEATADSVCLYFHDPSYFDAESMAYQISIAPGLMVTQDGELVTIALKHVYCVVRGADQIYEFHF